MISPMNFKSCFLIQFSFSNDFFIFACFNEILNSKIRCISVFILKPICDLNSFPSWANFYSDIF